MQRNIIDIVCILILSIFFLIDIATAKTQDDCGYWRIPGVCNGSYNADRYCAFWYCAYDKVGNNLIHCFTLYSSCTKDEAGSLICENDRSLPFCKQPDTTYTCQSVFTENNVVRSEIQKKIDGVASGDPLYVYGSCAQNGYCNGTSNAELDSCTYELDANNCKPGGKNGSLCTYVCPDGRLYACRQITYSGVNIPDCPTKPWKSCADSIGRPKPKYEPTEYKPVSDTISGGYGEDIPTEGDGTDKDYTGYLQAIVDTLHRANQQRKEQMYVGEQIYDNIAGFGAYQGDGIYDRIGSVVANTANINTTLQTNTNNAIKGITTALQDTLNVQVVNMPVDSVIRFNYDYSYVSRIDTATEDIQGSLDLIKSSLDTLVNDTPRTNVILQGIVPVLISMNTALQRLVGDNDRFKPIVDAINAQTEDIRDMFEVDDALLDSIQADTLDIDTSVATYDGNVNFDSLRSAFAGESWAEKAFDKAFFEDSDSLMRAMDSTFKAIQERLKDTTRDSVPLDTLAGDSALIRQKLDGVFLPVQTREECFAFAMDGKISVPVAGKTRTFDLSLAIDFADMFGLDLCQLIRLVVRILTTLAIVITTIKGYIKAFGGWGGD